MCCRNQCCYWSNSDTTGMYNTTKYFTGGYIRRICANHIQTPLTRGGYEVRGDISENKWSRYTCMMDDGRHKPTKIRFKIHFTKTVDMCHISWSSLNHRLDHFCWNILSYSGFPTRLHCPHSRLPGESHISEHPLFSPVVSQWLRNQMQSAWDVAAVRLLTFES